LIVAKDFVYLHSPKTGGTFVRTMLNKLGEACPDLGISDLKDLKHAGSRQIPRKHEDKVMLTTVRHPLSHYVSRYHFAGWEQKMPIASRMSRIQKHYPTFPNLTFSQFLRLRNDWNVILPRDSKMKRVLVDKRIGSETRALLRLIERDPCELLENLDLLEDRALASRFENVKFLKTENLNKDLHDFLLSVGLKPEHIGFVRKQERIVPTRKLPIARRWRHFTRDLGKKGDWQDYYTDEEMDWICDLERFFFRLFPESYRRPDTSGHAKSRSGAPFC
jgi:hypothetical protein